MTEAISANTSPANPVANGGGTLAATDRPKPLPLVLLGHDLRAALADMRAGLHLIRDFELPASEQAALKRCIASGDALARLIDQSVMVCLGQGSPGLTHPVNVNIPSFLADLQAHWAEKARETGHRFFASAAAGLPECFFMDRTALDRMLANLIANALRHTPACDVALTLRAGPSGTGLEIDLADSGPGFSDAQLAAFATGFCLPGELRRPGGGFGLQSVGYLVQSLGGRCDITNRREGGALVRLSLPLPPDQNGMPPPLQKTGKTRAGLAGVKVLLAEDSVAIRALVHTILTDLGAEVTVVADGISAVAALSGAACLPDVLVLDDDMPRMSGLTVLHWMTKTIPVAKRPVVLAHTCQTAPDQLDALSQAGAAAVRKKPILDPDDWETLLRALLDARAIPSPAPAPDLPTPDLAAPDFVALRRLAEIAGPAAAELFEKLTEDLERAQRGLALAAAQTDIPGIRRHSHVLIALAGTAGATLLHGDAVQLNGLAHQGAPLERIVALAQKLDRGTADLLSAVQNIPLPTPGGPLDT